MKMWKRSSAASSVGRAQRCGCAQTREFHAHQRAYSERFVL